MQRSGPTAGRDDRTCCRHGYLPECFRCEFEPVPETGWLARVEGWLDRWDGRLRRIAWLGLLLGALYIGGQVAIHIV